MLVEGILKNTEPLSAKAPGLPKAVRPGETVLAVEREKDKRRQRYPQQRALHSEASDEKLEAATDTATEAEDNSIDVLA